MSRLQLRRSRQSSVSAGHETPQDGHAPEAAAAGGPTIPPTGSGPRRMPRTFESFREREFRAFYISMLAQMAAMNMQLVIRGLLAYELTGSYAALGLVGLAGALPNITLAVFGGVLADRKPKRTILQVGQAASLLNAAALATLSFTGLITFQWLLVSALGQGVVMALMMPARQSMIPEIVNPTRMMNAVSLTMAGQNSMRLFAPALGGFIVGFFGFGVAFTTMAVLYGLAVVGMARVTPRPAETPGEVGLSILATGKSAVADVGGGLAYMWRDRTIFIILGMTFLTSALGMPIQFLLPGYVSDIFAEDASEAANMAGVLLSVSGVGAVASALVLASLPDRRRGWMFLLGAATLGFGVFLFAQADTYLLAAFAMVVVGLGSSLRQALSQGLLLSNTEPAYRGRVMSVFMTQISVMQLATFIVGVLAEFVGIRVVMAGLGLLLMGLTVLYAVMAPTIRRLD